MAIHFTMTGQDTLLMVHTWGYDENLQEVMDYGTALIKACVAGGYTHLLCDERDLEYRLGTLDTYQSAKYMSEQAPRLARIAIVANEKFIQDAQFWETVAVNRGLTVRVFKDPVPAREWLGVLISN